MDNIATPLPESKSSFWWNWLFVVVLVVWVSINIYWDRTAYINLNKDVEEMRVELEEGTIRPADVYKQVIDTQRQILSELKRHDDHLTGIQKD